MSDLIPAITNAESALARARKALERDSDPRHHLAKAANLVAGVRDELLMRKPAGKLATEFSRQAMGLLRATLWRAHTAGFVTEPELRRILARLDDSTDPPAPPRGRGGGDPAGLTAPAPDPAASRDSERAP